MIYLAPITGRLGVPSLQRLKLVWKLVVRELTIQQKSQSLFCHCASALRGGVLLFGIVTEIDLTSEGSPPLHLLLYTITRAL